MNDDGPDPVVDYAKQADQKTSPPVIEYAKPSKKKASTYALRVTLALLFGIPVICIGVLSLIGGVGVIIDLCHRISRKIYEEDITQAIVCPLLGLLCIVMPIRWFISLSREGKNARITDDM